MNPDGTPITPQEGTPPVGMSDAEYQDQAAAMHSEHTQQAAQQPAPKPAPTNDTSGFFDKVKDTARAVTRGVVDAGRATGDTLNELNKVSEDGGKEIHDKLFGASAPDNFVKTWYNTPLVDSHPMTDGEVEGLLGKKQTGVEGAVEDITQFAAGVALTSEAMGPATLLSKLPLVAGAVRVGIGAAVATNPYEKRLSSLLATAPSYISGPAQALLISNPETDGPIVARLKNGLENTLTAFALDGFISKLKYVRDLKGATTDAEKAEIKPPTVTYNPEVHGPIRVEPTADGQSQLVHTSLQPGRRSGDVYHAAPGESLSEVRKAQPHEIEFLQKRMPYDKFKETYPNSTTTKAEWDAVAKDVAERPPREVWTPEQRAERAPALKADAPPVGGTTETDWARPHVVRGPVFATAAEAEGVGASMNGSILNENRSLSLLNPESLDKLTSAGAQAMTDAGFANADLKIPYSAPPAETDKVIQGIAEKTPAVVQTHAQTVALADDLLDGKTGEQVVQMLKDKNVATADMPQHVAAAKMVLKNLGTQVSKLGQALDASPDNGVAADELRKATENLFNVEKEQTTLARTSGRALDAHKIGNVAADGTADATASASPFDKWGKTDLAAFARLVRMSDGDPTAILQLMRSQSEVAAARLKAAPEGFWANASAIADKTMSKVNGIRLQALLAGPHTQIIYMMSHAITSFHMASEQWWGGVQAMAWDGVRGNGTAQGAAMAREGADQMVGLTSQIRESWRAASRSFMTGTSPLDAGNHALENGAGPEANYFLHGLSNTADLPGRMLMTTAEFFRTLNYRAAVYAQSLRMAREEGMTGAADLATRVADDMKMAFSETGAAVNPKALKVARTATFSNPLEEGTAGRAVQQFVQDNPAARLIVPFVRTPVNLNIYAWQRFPGLGLLQREMRRDLAAGGEDAARAWAKQSLGLAAYGGAASLAYQKLITGGGPKDVALRKQWIDAGNQPYSVKIPGFPPISYERANPVLTPLGLAADAVEMSGEVHQSGWSEIPAAIGAAVASYAHHQTYVQGLASALDAFASGDVHTVAKVLRDIEGSFVPNAGRQLDPNDTYREVRGMVDEFKSRVPGLSETLEPRRNIMGEPVMKPPGHLGQVLNPFTFGGKVDAVQQQLVSLGKAMSMPPEKIGDAVLTDRDLYDNGNGKNQSPYDRMLELVSKPIDGMPNLRSAMTDLVKSNMWKEAGSGTENYVGGARYKMASHVISKYQDAAKKEVMSEYPKLLDAVQGQKTDKKQALAAPPSRPQFITQ